MTSLTSHPARRLHGRIRVPGDKSISHRTLMLAALCVGETQISGLLEGDDVLSTAAAMRALGAEVTRGSDGVWRVFGCGVGGLSEPSDVIDMGNAGTGVRLLMGLVATHPITCTFVGDASLSRRPMARVMDPLRAFGTEFVARDGGLLPVTVKGTPDPIPVTSEMAVPSAQVKSAVLLAGLNTPGTTTVIEKVATRDHTENMLRHFGAEVTTTPRADGTFEITLSGQPELVASNVAVPSDVSSAAFPMVAGLLASEGEVTVDGVGLNPSRTGLIDCLLEMGALLEITNRRTEGGEPVGDVVVRPSALHGIDVPPERAASMIDEYPVLCAAAACANGTTRMTEIGELRVKESDRLAAMEHGLQACGVTVRAGDDWLEVDGRGAPPTGGATIAVDLDHRIAMSFLVLGIAAQAPIAIDDANAIATSFPGFADLMNDLGTKIEATT